MKVADKRYLETYGFSFCPFFSGLYSLLFDIRSFLYFPFTCFAYFFLLLYEAFGFDLTAALILDTTSPPTVSDFLRAFFAPLVGYVFLWNVYIPRP